MFNNSHHESAGQNHNNAPHPHHTKIPPSGPSRPSMSTQYPIRPPQTATQNQRAPVITNHGAMQNNTNQTRAIPPIVPGQTTNRVKNVLTIHPRQKDNPVIQNIRNTPYEFKTVNHWDEFQPDFLISETIAILYIQVRYHRLTPDYIHQRVKALKNDYIVRILLVEIDTTEHHETIKELTKMSIINNITIMCAWSPGEAAKYIETYKALEKKSADVLKERVEDNYIAQMTNVLTSIRSINKTDVATLLGTFGSLRNIAHAEIEDLIECQGFGEAKCKRLYDAFRNPFRKVVEEADPKGKRKRVDNAVSPARTKELAVEEDTEAIEIEDY